MRSLSLKQIFIDALRLYFAPLTGAVRGCVREVRVVSREISRRKYAQAPTHEVLDGVIRREA